MIVGVALAADTIVESVTQTSPILEYIKEIAFTLVAIGGTWLLIYVKKMLGLKTDDLMANRIRMGIINGLRGAYSQYSDAIKKAGKVPVKNELVSQTFDYLKDHYPDAVKYHGITKADDIASMVESYLPLVTQEREAEAPPPAPV